MSLKRILQLTSLTLAVGMVSALLPAMPALASTNAAAFDNTSEPATNTAVRPGTNKLVVMNVVLSNSGATTLDAITFTNTGTAIEAASGTTDIMVGSVTVWLDGGDNVFDPTSDTNVGTATRTADTAWALDTNQALGAANRRIYVTVDVSSTATTGRTFIWRIPTLNDVNTNGAFNSGDVGVYYASADDGPADTNKTNSNTLTIKINNVNIDVSIPDAPTNLQVGAGSNDTSLVLNWTASSSASSYRIYRSNSNANTGQMILDGLVATTYTDTGLMPGTTYYYLVQSIGSNGAVSSNQTQVSGTTSAPAPATPETPATPATPTTPTTPTTPPTTTGPATPVDATKFDYRAAWVSQSGTVTADGKAHEVTGAAGSTIELSLTLKNIGGAWWYPTSPDGAHLIKLGTWNPADGLSSLEHGTWLSANRIVQAGSVVKTGDSYTFTFKVNVPQGAAGTVYKLYARPVAEWVEWFGPEGIFWQIRVV